MNDFTKEELELISSGIDYWFERKYNPRVEVLLDKVQEIINTYCEHNDQRGISDVDYIRVCCDCEQLIGWY